MTTATTEPNQSGYLCISCDQRLWSSGTLKAHWCTEKHRRNQVKYNDARKFCSVRCTGSFTAPWIIVDLQRVARVGLSLDVLDRGGICRYCGGLIE
jgi:hypothetical protein